jgi:hypothetical protein
MQAAISQCIRSSFPVPKSKRVLNKSGQNSSHTQFIQPKLEGPRINYLPASCPQKYISPFSLFQRFLSDGSANEEDRAIPAVPTFHYFNQISEVQYDQNRGVLTTFVESEPNVSTASWYEISQVLGLQEESNIIECYNLLESFRSSMKKNELSEKVKTNAMGSGFGRNKQEYDELRSEIEQKHATCYIKTIMKPNNPTIIEYNIHLLNLIGTTPNVFATRLLNEGIVEIYPNAQKRYANSVELFIRLLLSGSYDGTPVEKKEELYHINNYMIQTNEKIYLMRSINENQELEIEILVVFFPEEKSEKMEEELQLKIKPQRVFEKPAEMIPSCVEKEREEFLMKFYNIKKKDSNDLARTCRIRYL